MSEKLSRSIGDATGRIRGQCDEIRACLQGVRARCLTEDQLREQSGAVLMLCAILAEVQLIESLIVSGVMTGQAEGPLKASDLPLHPKRRREGNVEEARLPLPLLLEQEQAEASGEEKRHAASLARDGDDTLTTSILGGSRQ